MKGSTLRYIVQRTIASALVIIGVATLVFVVVRAVPGDPVESILGEQALDLDKESMRECLRLDEPLARQYLLYLGDVLDGSFGHYCDAPERTVRDDVSRVMLPTIQLALVSLALALLFSIPLGIAAAVRHRTWTDGIILTIAMLGVAMPNFWLGPLLLLIFSVSLAWLPAPGAFGGLLDLVLPAITLSTALMAKLTRMTRTSLLEQLSAEHVRTARAKGLGERVVLLKHALRPALTPILSIAGLQLGALLAGAIIVEKVFARPGLGSLLVQAIERREYALVQGCVLVIATCYVLVNWLTDMLYVLADPRMATEADA